MRMRHRATAALAALVLTAASAGPALATGDDHDNAFLTDFHQGNLTEVAAGRSAQTYGTTRCVKIIGRVLVHDHARLDKQLKDVAEKQHVSLPRSITPQQEKGLKNTRKKGHTIRFDEAWLRIQDTAHVVTLQLLDSERHKGNDADDRELARRARPVISKHLDMVRDCMFGFNGRRR